MNAMEPIQANRTELSAEANPNAADGRARQCVIRDRRGRRMVMPRYTTADAIEQIARAFAGRNATPEAKRLAWEHLRDQQGFTIEWIEPKQVRVV